MSRPFPNRLVGWLRSELKVLEFKWEPTLLVVVFMCVLLAPVYLRNAWFHDLLQRIAGNEFAENLREHGLRFRELLRIVAPVAVILLMRHRLREYGLGLGDVKAGALLCLAGFVIFVPCFFLLLNNEAFREYYGGVKSRYGGWPEFWRIEGARTFAVMATTEFFYRGYLLFGLKRYYGTYAAVLAALIPYVFGHYPKVPLEAYGSIPVGLALSYVAIRTNSIWYGVILHAVIALGMAAVIFAASAT